MSVLRLLLIVGVLVLGLLWSLNGIIVIFVVQVFDDCYEVIQQCNLDVVCLDCYKLDIEGMYGKYVFVINLNNKLLVICINCYGQLLL